MVMATILAAANAKPDLGILPLIVLAVALAVAVTLAYRVYRDVKGEPEGPLTEPDDLLNSLTEAYASGQMSREEYLRARAAVDRTGLGEPRSTLPIRPRIDGAGAGDEPAADETPTLPGDEPGRG